MDATDANRVIGQIREILDPILIERELELVEITFRMEGGRWILIPWRFGPVCSN